MLRGLLENLPFQKGDQVEIIILDLSTSQTDSDSMPLKGTLISYDELFESATAPED